MEMEQRVGRVHRFGSRETILVDTIVVRDSRETQAWSVARERLTSIAHTLVAPDRFETVFSRVMCLIPPEELQTVLINSPASPLADIEVQRLSSLVDSGFRDWQSFHGRYAANQRQIHEQPSGLARWHQLRDFLICYGGAEPAAGIAKTRFIQHDGQEQTVDESAEVLRCFVGDYDGGLFSGQTAGIVGPLGLNIPPVADLLCNCANPPTPTGAAHLRWGDNQKELRARLGEDVVILAFARQTFRLDSVGGINEVGIELVAYVINAQQSSVLSAEDRAALFDMNRLATVRLRPVDSPLFTHAVSEEQRLIDELRRPSEEAIRQGVRYAVWPILALHLSP
jgi:hypothetical protein